MTRIVTIANEKGGIGKTTTAQQLATGLQKKGFKVLIIDLDNQRNLSSCFGDTGQPIKRVFDLMNGEDIQNCIFKIQDNFFIIYGDDRMSQAEKIFVEIDSESILDESLSKIKSYFDYIIIDTPPRSKSIAVNNAFMTSDEIIIPMQANTFSIEGLQKILDSYRRAKKMKEKQGRSLEVLGILLTMHEDRTLFRRGITKQMEDLSKNIQIPIFETTIRRAIAIEEAQAMKTNIFDYQPKSNISRDYSKFVEEFIKKDKELQSKMNISNQ